MQNNIGEARRSYSLKIGHEITQDEAAEMFGVSPSGYKKWEQGVGKLNGEILCAIADKYECSTDYLLCRTSDPACQVQRRRERRGGAACERLPQMHQARADGGSQHRRDDGRLRLGEKYGQ